MANRREEERERLREAREEREKKQRAVGARRLMLGYVAAGVDRPRGRRRDRRRRSSPAAAARRQRRRPHRPGSGSTNGIQPDDRTGTPPPPAKVTNLKEAAKKAGCELRLHLPDEGHEPHPAAAPTPEYKTNPPTSGNHVEPPYQQADGAYSEMPQEIDFVHSLEHGRMEIQYSPDLPEKRPAGTEGALRHDVRRRRCSSPTTRCPTRSPRRPGPTCSAATNTRARSRSTRSAPSARRPGANPAASRSNGLPLHRPDPGRTDRTRAQRSAPVGREEAAAVAAAAEVGRRPRGSQTSSEVRQGMLAVGEAALELLERGRRG